MQGVNGTNFNDTIFGTDGDNTFNGGKGDDHLFGGTGANVMSGGDGNDTTMLQFKGTRAGDAMIPSARNHAF